MHIPTVRACLSEKPQRVLTGDIDDIYSWWYSKAVMVPSPGKRKEKGENRCSLSILSRMCMQCVYP